MVVAVAVGHGRSCPLGLLALEGSGLPGLLALVSLDCWLWSPWTAGAGAMLWSDYASGFSSYLCRDISLFIAHTPCQRQHLVSPCARAMRATRKGWRRGETRLAKCAKRTPITCHSSETISVLSRASAGPSRLHGLPHPRTRPTIVRASVATHSFG